MKIDIHYFDTNGNELRCPAAYSQADIGLTNIFFNKAQKNDFKKTILLVACLLILVIIINLCIKIIYI